MPIMVPPSAPSGILRYQLIDRNNVTRELSRDFSPNLFIEKGSVGFGAPTFEIASDKYPFGAGEFLRHINTNSRKVVLPIVINEDAMSDLVDVAEDLFDWFFAGDESNDHPPIFRITREDDSVRQIRFYYIQGLEGDMDVGSPNFTRYVVEGLVLDPYPTGAENIIINKTRAEGLAGFGVMNPGNIETWPYWVLTGPFTNMLILNEGTGEQIFTSTMDIPAGGYAVFDTRPADIRDGLSVHDHLGNSQLHTIVPSSRFWTLRPGLTNVHINFGVVGSPLPTIELRYLPRYRSLLR